MSVPADPVPALWSLMIEATEAGHDALVLAQRRPTLRAASAARSWADDVAALARAAEIATRRKDQR